MMQEELGYLEGGTETLVSALVGAITKNGGTVNTSCPAHNISKEKDGRLTVTSGDEAFSAKHVISTVPTPLISRMVPSLPEAAKAQSDAIPNIGVACLIFKLKTSVSDNFWLNIIDENHAIPGLIEFSNLRPVDDGHIVYAPYYMPVTNLRWAWSDDALLDEAFAAIQAANPAIEKSDIMATQVSRLKHAQPICYPNFKDMLPPIQTAIEGLQIADTCYYYPEDRGISESIGLGRTMAQTVVKAAADAAQAS
jgi:protoporphyrinogen oxidase